MRLGDEVEESDSVHQNFDLFFETLDVRIRDLSRFIADIFDFRFHFENGLAKVNLRLELGVGEHWICS